MMPSTLLIADNQSVYREGLRGWLAREPDLVVAGEADDPEAAIATAITIVPTLIVAEAVWPKRRGPEIIARLRTAAPRSRLLVLTAAVDPPTVIAVLQAGVHGYLLKDRPPVEIVSAIRQTIAGPGHFDPRITETLVEQILPARGNGGVAAFVEPLTPREREVLRHITAGRSNRDIAAALNVSERTVETHARHIYHKLGVSGRSGAIRLALREGIVSPSDLFR